MEKSKITHRFVTSFGILKQNHAYIEILLWDNKLLSYIFLYLKKINLNLVQVFPNALKPDFHWNIKDLKKHIIKSQEIVMAKTHQRA
jgi:hypothetical protein